MAVNKEYNEPNLPDTRKTIDRYKERCSLILDSLRIDFSDNGYNGWRLSEELKRLAPARS
jgi:hypothetical protein